MGATQSKNIVKAVIQANTKIINDALMDSSVGAVSVNSLNFTGCDVSNFKSDQSNQYLVSTKSYQDVVNSSQIHNQMAIAASQMAQAVSQNLTLNPGKTDSENVMNAVIKVANEIINKTTTLCNVKLAQENAINCTASNLNGIIISQENIAQVMTDCVQEAVSDSDVVNDLEEKLKQTAVAKQQNAIAMIMIVAAVILLLLIIYKVAGAGKGGAGGKFVTVLIVLIIIPLAYLIVARWKHLWPFKDITKGPCPCKEPYACNTNATPNYCGIPCSTTTPCDPNTGMVCVQGFCSAPPGGSVCDPHAVNTCPSFLAADGTTIQGGCVLSKDADGNPINVCQTCLPTSTKGACTDSGAQPVVQCIPPYAMDPLSGMCSCLAPNKIDANGNCVAN